MPAVFVAQLRLPGHPATFEQVGAGWLSATDYLLAHAVCGNADCRAHLDARTYRAADDRARCSGITMHANDLAPARHELARPEGAR